MTDTDGETADPAEDFFDEVHGKTPEVVGAVSSIEREECSKWQGEAVGRCRAEATHSVLIFDGQSFETIAVCDDCGRPEDLDLEAEREWTGEIRR